MITRSHLRHFLAVVDAGNFTRAAERLGITQPSLSTSIARLEGSLGARLFVREKRRIQLTEAGNRLVGQARAMEREFRAIEASLAVAQAPADPLRLGILTSLDTGFVTRLGMAYMGERPLTIAEGTDVDLRRRLSERRLDAVITTLRDSEGDHALFEESYAMLLSSRHRLAGRASLQAEELAGETMVARRSCELLAATSRFFTARGVRPHFIMRSANDERCLAVVREGLAVTTGPRSLAGAGIVDIALEGYDYHRTIGVIAADEAVRQQIDHACREALHQR